MLALTAIPITCWLCAWLAKPGKPLVGSEVQELVYGRLLGRQQRLTLLALIVTGMTLVSLVVTLPQRIDPNLQSVRSEHAKCDAQLGKDETDSGRDATAATTVKCPELEAGGMWVIQEYPRGNGERPWPQQSSPHSTSPSVGASPDTVRGSAREYSG